MDNIQIDDLKGGFGVTAVIRNTGGQAISDLVWSIDFGDVAKIGRYSSRTISLLSGYDEIVIRSGFVFGLGFGTVTVVTNEFSIVQNYFILGLFVFLKKGAGNQIINHDMIVNYRAGDQKTLDPADAYDAESTDLISQIYDTLVTFQGNDSQTFSPCLATDWTVSVDSLTYTFHLRPNVKFSNGNDFTAEDVKYSFDRVLTMNAPESGVDWILGQCMDTDSTTILDDHTLQITLTEPYGGFLALLAFTVAAIVDKDYVEANGGVVPGETNIWMKEHPMGTGPYMVKSTENTSEVLLIKNPLYWGGWDGNHVEKVFFRTTPDIGERISALLDGVADFTYVPYEILWDVIGEEGIVVQPFDSYDVSLLSINTKASNNEFLADGQVRKAFSFAFDYNTAIETAWDGYASRLLGAIPTGMPYYETQNNGQPYYTFDLSMAENILDDAGYLKDYCVNGTLYRFNGVTMRLFYNAGNSEREKMAVMFRDALEDIGIRSSVIAEEWPQLLHRIYTTDDWDMVFVGWGPDYNDPDVYIGPFIGSADIGQDTYNTGYRNDTVDKKILEAKYSADPAVRAAAYTAAFDIYIQEPPYIFLVQQQYIRPMRDWIMNYSYNPAPSLCWNFYDCYKEGLHDKIFSERLLV
ncbi:MAG TPA: ABC transporter substrate-binding protein [Candidatus Thermoplasmatota archaeon]|nr:ABC transporter substrate-binding protein [Candidatus Thermoplasmatota archaeon]